MSGKQTDSVHRSASLEDGNKNCLTVPVYGINSNILKDNMTFKELFSTKEWKEYFHGFSGMLDYELNVYDEDCSHLFSTNINAFCKIVRSAHVKDINCPESCTKSMIESLESDTGPVICKCPANLINFAFPVEHFGERVFFIGTGGFSEYEDLLECMKIIRKHSIRDIPLTGPLNFTGMDYAESICRYVHLTVYGLLKGFDEKYRLEEKLLRMTSLFDSQAFGTLARNPELMYRYILDTVEFVFGSMSTALMVPDENRKTLYTVCSTGEHGEGLADFVLDSDSQFIQEMLNTGTSVFRDDLKDIKRDSGLEHVGHMYLFPVFVNSTLKAVIGIFGRKLERRDRKIMNAFKDYIQLNLENHNLRMEISKKRRADKNLTSFIEFSNSITSILDLEMLLNGLLEKTVQILNAEQGSLMLLDSETSELVVEAHKSFDDIVQKKMRIRKDEGIAGRVLEKGVPLLVEDIERDPRIRQANRPRYRTKSFLSVPIKIEERLSGILNISDKNGGGAFNEEDLQLIESFINNVAIAIERSILHEKTEELQKLSITDPLTGVYNRRYLNRRLSEEITRYNRYKQRFSFMMLDLDKFKDYNDTFGHMAGDNLIKDLARIIESSLRTIDIAARFGGDEFVAVFPQTPKEDAIQITNRLKERIDKALNRGYSEMMMSVSMGLATYPDDASSIMELVEKTDQALYLAKKGGGNRIVYL